MDMIPALETGLVEYAHRSGESSTMDVRLAADAYQKVSSFFAAALQPDEGCRLAFPGMVINTGGRPRLGLVAVMDFRVLAAWSRGVFAKTIEHLEVPLDVTTEASWGRGSVATYELAIDTGSHRLAVALPQNNARTVGDLIVATIRDNRPQGE